MNHREMIEAIAQTLNESRILGMFAEGTAHELITTQFADIFTEENPRFDRKRFLIESGVIMVDHSNDEPIRKVCSNKFVQG
ncbi:hypothetical protein HUN41_00280 [Streptomyces phage Coruscant]|uniref:Uncharacterized protein n=1 Tax=Streptomyces phage Coruscant TaxID=2739834 RepID=A0A7G4AVV4_9CAUD|nr:hypothetical protein PP454_gp014 [Streptomyces phage Coruscant]YP_010651603.1 hypothetical protein PP454_gp049 [Streptomyces phage Coruscant]QMP84144.1 hypothetical protein HUN41_00014 [Streptomyces phage Coruscant]QMP84368.1 hypothetical protein HUN41_00280 [Streptomyces phage Coruscant]